MNAYTPVSVRVMWPAPRGASATAVKVWDVLRRASVMTTAEVSRALGRSLRAVRVDLDELVSLGYATRRTVPWTPPPGTDAFVTPSGAGYRAKSGNFRGETCRTPHDAVESLRRALQDALAALPSPTTPDV